MKDLNPDLFDLFRLVSTINLAVLVRLAFAGSDMQENILFTGSGAMLRSGDEFYSNAFQEGRTISIRWGRSWRLSFSFEDRPS